MRPLHKVPLAPFSGGWFFSPTMMTLARKYSLSCSVGSLDGSTPKPCSKSSLTTLSRIFLVSPPHPSLCPYFASFLLRTQLYLWSFHIYFLLPAPSPRVGPLKTIQEQCMGMCRSQFFWSQKNWVCSSDGLFTGHVMLLDNWFSFSILIWNMGRIRIITSDGQCDDWDHAYKRPREVYAHNKGPSYVRYY